LLVLVNLRRSNSFLHKPIFTMAPRCRQFVNLKLLTLVLSVLLLSKGCNAFIISENGALRRLRASHPSLRTMENEEAEIQISIKSPPAILSDDFANEEWCRMDAVKNVRDLASVRGAAIRPGRILRTGLLSNASPNDVGKLTGQLGLRTVIDLRSPRELGDDARLRGAPIFDGFQQVDWNDPSCPSGECELVDAGKQRYFISLIDEKKYKWGAIRKLRKREKAMVLLYLAAGIASKRAFARAKSVVLGRINEGGLSMLNELLMLYSGKGVAECLKIIATRERHPVAIHCTAGKDRTGFVSMLVLKVLGAGDGEIVADYTLSDSAYRDLNDRKAMVGALQQEDLDPDKFLCAPAYVMEDTLRCLETQYGSVDGYLDSIGFDEKWRSKLRKALTDP